MTYSTIQPPFTLQFRDMAKKDLIAYAAWFHDSAPARIAEVTGAVKSTVGYERWEPNMTPESLEDLGRWFESQVETRKKGHEESEETRAKLTFPIDIPKVQLTNRTFSLAMDIGMYFAEVVLKYLPGTRWGQPLGNKKFADYGQPVIMGFGTVPLNPVRVIVTNAYKAANKEQVDLRRRYDAWARMKRCAPSLRLASPRYHGVYFNPHMTEVEFRAHRPQANGQVSERAARAVGEHVVERGAVRGRNNHRGGPAREKLVSVAVGRGAGSFYAQ